MSITIHLHHITIPVKPFVKPVPFLITWVNSGFRGRWSHGSWAIDYIHNARECKMLRESKLIYAGT